MIIKEELEKFGLNPNNAVVIGSGILDALNIRKSNDIDVVVAEETYLQLCNNDSLKKSEKRGLKILTNDLFEIGTNWVALGKNWRLNDFLKESVIIDGVRYVTLEFLLAVKRSWVSENDARQKDIDDINLIEDYQRSIA